jgi:predicted nucleic acid-binding protein
MIVVDTSAFVSLAVGDVIETVLKEFEVVTTQAVWAELDETAAYDDVHGRGAEAVQSVDEQVQVLDVDGAAYVTSRIDEGEASCVAAVDETDAAFLITDDYRALPELQALVGAEGALSPIVLRALVKRGVLTEEEAGRVVDVIAEQRDWLGAPINRYVRQLFE